MSRLFSSQTILRGAAAGALCAVLLLGCDGPIVARSPEALYALAKEQMAHANYSPAVDTLARVVREAPQSESARRAHVLRIALLGGMARGFKDVAESYRAGAQQAGAAAYATQMRSLAMDYFSRARGRSIEMVEALDRLMSEAATGPLRVDFPLPEVAAADSAALGKVRQGNWVEDPARLQAEQEEVRQGLAEMLATVLGAGGDIHKARGRFRGREVELDLAVFYLGLAQEIVDISSIYGPQALQDRRVFRLYHKRALAAAEQAARLAGEKGNTQLQEESERLKRHCQEVLRKL